MKLKAADLSRTLEYLLVRLRKNWLIECQPDPAFRVVALIAMRNEEHYIGRCLEHLISQGVESYIIDNDSTDRSTEIVRSYLGRGVLGLETFPYKGYYDWTGILKRKEKLSQELKADWFTHYDPDEIREAPRPHRTLREGIWVADRLGYNAVNFDEFVFMPTGEEEAYEGRDYVAEMMHYYFLAPSSSRHIKAWKKTGAPVDLVSTAGHRVNFPGLKLYPEDFILRHYIFLSKAHALRKYCTRVFSPEELTKGWHTKRAAITPEGIRLPTPKEMRSYRCDGVWDRSAPCKSHKFLKT